MFKVEDLQTFGQAQMQNASTSAGALSKGLQSLASETASFSSKAIETSSSFMGKAMGVKSLDGVLELQSDYARHAYEAMVIQSTRMGDIVGAMTKEVFKPMAEAFAKARTTATQMTTMR